MAKLKNLFTRKAGAEATMEKGSVVAQRLKQARVRAGLSQMDLGIAAGIDAAAASARISQYERDKHTPDFETAERLAQVLGVPTPYLYARDDMLATWILMFDKVSAALKRSILKKAGKIQG